MSSPSRVVTVVGAGFSGLSIAYFLQKKGIRVTVLERASHTGGLLQTIRRPEGLVEQAANGILRTALVEKVAADLGLNLQGVKAEAKKRYIFRRVPRRWPLNPFETLRTIAGYFLRTRGRRAPRAHESVGAWGRRVLGQAATRFILAPALRGIYAADADGLSANLILGRFFKAGRKTSARPVTTAPIGGMHEFISALENYLRRAGVTFACDTEVTVDAIAERRKLGPVVVATSIAAAGQLLGGQRPDFAARLKSIDMISLSTVTQFYPKTEAQMAAFGCLFPAEEKFFALGALFNSFIFAGRSDLHSETWIVRGEHDESSLLKKIATDRERLYRRKEAPVASYVKPWPQALPTYSLGLENLLAGPEFSELEKEGLFFMGNYRGLLGLSGILETAEQMAERVRA